MPGGRSAARAFPPDPNNLGGVQQIMDEYYHMKERINSVKPSTIRIASTAHVQEDLSLAQRLSRNRAARRAANDPVPVEHINRLYHLHRRIEDSYNRTQRLKDPWDTSVHPVYLRRDTNPYLDMLKDEMAHWRPSSAPVWVYSKKRADKYSGWSVGNSLPMDYPTSRYVESHRLADHAVYKKAIMAEVLDNRMYKEADLRKLFKAYIRLAPLSDRDTVIAVVEELKRELDVK